jgi:hypothetical protein
MSEPRKEGAPGLYGSGILVHCVMAADVASTSSCEISILPCQLVIYVGIDSW